MTWSKEDRKAHRRYKPSPTGGHFPRTAAHVEARLGETCWRTKDGQSAAFIADLFGCQLRTVVRYRNILRDRGELPPAGEIVAKNAPVRTVVHLVRAVPIPQTGRLGRRYTTVVACGADVPKHHPGRSWGYRREITCEQCRKIQMEDWEDEL